ncbi:hypothetical protein WISP_83563 [Willisornis vidua]|uniref:Uncharacterized protein n=1 Tax=Willisornis vidua TaxID=1566151 RepID=A0ABQ9D9P4_9PASS|nr:hypothetical protein WISP_83563 [Willisornis vidua]
MRNASDEGVFKVMMLTVMREKFLSYSLVYLHFPLTGPLDEGTDYTLGMTFYAMEYPFDQFGSAVLALLSTSFSCFFSLAEHEKLKAP